MSPTLDEFINEAVQREGLRFYFDTTVILDLLRPKRRPESHELLDVARANKWKCVSSFFALMEALDIEQENMWFRSRIRAGEDVDSLSAAGGSVIPSVLKPRDGYGISCIEGSLKCTRSLSRG